MTIMSGVYAAMGAVGTRFVTRALCGPHIRWDWVGKARSYAKRRASSTGSTSGSGKVTVVSNKSQKPVPVGDSESGRKTQQIAVSSHPPSSAGRPDSGPVHTTSRDAGSVVSGTSASPRDRPPSSVYNGWDVERTGSESVPLLQIPTETVCSPDGADRQGLG